MNPKRFYRILGACRTEPAYPMKKERMNQLVKADRSDQHLHKYAPSLRKHSPNHLPAPSIPSCGISSGQIQTAGEGHGGTCSCIRRFRSSFLPKSKNDKNRPGCQSTSSITMESGRTCLGRLLADKQAGLAAGKSAERRYATPRLTSYRWNR